MAVLFIAFAIAMGVATFIENDYGTQTAKALVYNYGLFCDQFLWKYLSLSID